MRRELNQLKNNKNDTWNI